MSLAADAVDRLLQLTQAMTPRSPLRQIRFQDLQAERQPGQFLAELVVDLARDPPPLVLLRTDQAAQELRARGLGALSVGDVAEKPAKRGNPCRRGAHGGGSRINVADLCLKPDPRLELVRPPAPTEPRQALVEARPEAVDHEQAQGLADQELLPAPKQCGGRVIRLQNDAMVIGHQLRVRSKFEQLLIPQTVRVAGRALRTWVRGGRARARRFSRVVGAALD